MCLPCVTSPSVNRDFKLAIFRHFLSLGLFSPSHLYLRHLIFYLTKHILGAWIYCFSLFLSLPKHCTIFLYKHESTAISLQGLSLKWPEQINFNQRIVFQDNFPMIFFEWEIVTLSAAATSECVIWDYKVAFFYFPNENPMLCIS